MRDSNLNKILTEYYYKIKFEKNDVIINEMISDFKSSLINSILGLPYDEFNRNLLEYYHNIKRIDNKIEILESINNLNNILSKDIENYNNILIESASSTTKLLSNAKSGFNSKHAKLLERDKKWLKDNKKTILSQNFDEIELEILSDNKVTFENLLNRHNIFDKIFTNSANKNDLDSKLRRFEDKNGDLKNGLDNYFKTGTSRREIGLRKVKGEEAKSAVENMITYCESFLAGRSFIEEKINNIIISINDESVKESYELLYNPYRTYTLQEALEDNDDEINDILNDSEDDKNSNDIEQKEPTRGIQDRQIGITVLMTVAEERYFDYINLLKGLVE